MAELIILPILFIMLTGFLLVPWLAPVTAAVLLVSMIRNRQYLQAPFSCMLCGYGMISTDADEPLQTDRPR